MFYHMCLISLCMDQIMNIRCWDYPKGALSIQKWNMRFILEVHVSFKIYASEMEEYILSLVNILVNWYDLYFLALMNKKQTEFAPVMDS